MSMWDDEAGYDRDDPKHPAWAGSVLAAADLARKRELENPVEPVGDECDCEDCA